MKKKYEKPEITYIQLRPEEKLAVCSWPTGFVTLNGHRECNKLWSDVRLMYNQCLANSNNSSTSGS